MHNFIFVLFLLFVSPNLAKGQELDELASFEEQVIDSPSIITDKFKLKVRILESYTDTHEDLVLYPEQSEVYRNKLMITASSCIPDHQEIPGNDAGFITVRNDEGQTIFSGWLLKSFPGVSGFQHSLYNILIMSCEEL